MAAVLRSARSVLFRRLQPLSAAVPSRQLLQQASAAAQHAASSTLHDVIPLHSTPLPPPTSRQQGSEDEHSAWQAPPPDQWGQDGLLMSGCEPSSKLRVAVLLSGGVDSSLALRLLLAAGHQCTAFYLQIWFQEDFRNFWDACPWEEDLGYARKVCESLGVELQVVPMTTQYWDRVVSHSVNEIREGRTPNPDMLCNSCVKFGAFFDYLDTEHPGCFDRIASGHYARVVREPLAAAALGDGCIDTAVSHAQAGVGAHTPAGSVNTNERVRSQQGAGPGPSSSSGGSGAASSGGSGGLARLALTPDAVKDQTYFLAHLSPAQLSRAMFPLGPLTKKQVRQLAAAAQLANMDRKDSQGICFLGKVKFTEFVKEHLGEWPGLLVEAETSQVVGMHQGYWFYTVGQRSGIKLPGGPWYVLRKDRQLNVVFVSREYYADDKSRNMFVTGPINWVSHARPDLQQPIYCKVRHGPSMYKCASFELVPAADLLRLHEHGQTAAVAQLSAGLTNAASGFEPGMALQQGGQEAARVLLEGNDQGLAAGQYAVFYQDNVCLGAAKLL